MQNTAMNFQTPERREHRRGTLDGGPPRSQLKMMILGTYREMPGLSLHLVHAERLFGLRVGTCQVVLDDLVRLGHLRRVHDGQYRRS